MKQNFKLLCIIFILGISLPLISNACQVYQTPKTAQTEKDNKKYILHRVEKGETSYSISKKYQIDIKELYRLNPNAESSLKAEDELIIPKVQKVEYKSYKPQKGETVYSISKQYNTTVDDILNANPKLGTEGLKEGKAIKVPIPVYYKLDAPKVQNNTMSASPVMHKVSQRETLFGISREYGITIDELEKANPDLKSGLKSGMELVIPRKKQGETAIPVSNYNVPIHKSASQSKHIKLGVLLPFLDKEDGKNQRFIEYYEGLLLAVKSLKSKGYSLEVYTFDISDTKKLKGLLEASDIADLQMIIGGHTQEQIDLLSSFTKKEGIKYIIPFPSRINTSLLGDNVYQVGISHSVLYPKVSRTFIQKYKNDNIIFVSDKTAEDKGDFIKILKEDLAKKNISYTAILVDKSFDSSLLSKASKTARNVLIPSSSTYHSLVKILTTVKSLKNENPEIDITLFGYPDWQTYVAQLNADFTRFEVSFYSTFFATPGRSKDDFEATYQSTYNKQMMNTFPKYAMMGYDTGMFFLQTFADDKTKYTPIQNAFYFVQPQQKKTFINEGLFIIQYSESGVKRTDYSAE